MPIRLTMKKIALFILLAHTSTWAQGGSTECEQLETRANELIHKIHELNLGTGCSQMNVTNIKRSEASKKFFDDYKCQGLADIELGLRLAEGEIALRMFLEKTRDEVIRAQMGYFQYAQVKYKEDYPEIGSDSFTQKTQDFERALKVAAKIELMLEIEGRKDPIGKGENIFSYISGQKSFDPQISGAAPPINKEKMNTLVEDYCKGPAKKNQKTKCTELLPVDQDLTDAINEVITKADLSIQDKKDLRHLKNSLAVSKRGSTPYSFQEMQKSYEKNKEVLELPYINRAGDYDFLMNVNKPAMLMNEKANYQRLHSFIDDLRLRQESELQSKYSQIFTHNRSPLKSCSPGSLKDCLEELKGTIPEGLSRELTEGEEQLKALGELKKNCEQTKDSVITYIDKCQITTTTSVADLTTKAETLQALRQEIIKGAKDDILLYNFAVEEMKNRACGKVNETNIHCGPLGIGHISPEAYSLTGQNTQVIHALITQLPKGMNKFDISQLCRGPKKDKVLCDLGGKEPGPSATTTEEVEDDLAPRAIKGRNQGALMDTVAELLPALRGIFTPPMPQYPASLLQGMPPHVSYPVYIPPARIPGAQSISQQIAGPFLGQGNLWDN
jgi:hypothetical protein